MATALGCSWFDGLDDHPDVLDMLDFVQVPGWALTDDFERPHARLILHNLDLDWSLAAVDAIDPGWPGRLRRAIEITRTPWVSFHLGFASEQVRFDQHMQPVTPPLDRNELLGRIVEVVIEAQSLCPLQLLLENLDYSPEGAYEHVCDPAFIAEVIDLTGSGLLFDLAHWRVSCSWLGFDPLEALELLPLERVVEVHLSSPRPIGGGSGRLTDAHQPLEPFDYRLFAALLERSDPRAITIEYSRDIDTLRNQIIAMRDATL